MGGTTENEKGRHGGSLLFFKKKGDTITPETFFKGVTGDPGGSSSVSFDTDRCLVFIGINSLNHSCTIESIPD